MKIKNKKELLILIIVIISLVVVGITGYFIYDKTLKDNESNIKEPNNENNNGNNNTNTTDCNINNVKKTSLTNHGYKVTFTYPLCVYEESRTDSDFPYISFTSGLADIKVLGNIRQAKPDQYLNYFDININTRKEESDYKDLNYEQRVIFSYKNKDFVYSKLAYNYHFYEKAIPTYYEKYIVIYEISEDYIFVLEIDLKNQKFDEEVLKSFLDISVKKVS